MTATKKPDALRLALLKALGLDDDRGVRKVTVSCELGEVDRVWVEFSDPDLDTGEFTTELRHYELRDVT